MGDYIQILLLVVVGIILLWIGYCIFFGKMSPFYPFFFLKKNKNLRGKPGDPQVCPICSMRLTKGELVQSMAFPSFSGSKDRIMHIRGCSSCLENDIPRRCPVCKRILSVTDYLIARLFERSNRKNHIHVLGCNYCRIGSGKKQGKN
jgi:hypothetical protein